MKSQRLFGVVDRYLISLVARPLTISLGVVLVALLLERVLRLVNMLAESGAVPYWLLAALTASLVPHYVSLALAAAFFVAIFIAMSWLGDGFELDALFASGISIWRITLPFVLFGCVLAVVSLGLYGFLNPVSRYDYHRLLHTAVRGWDAKVPSATFINAGHGITITADSVDTTGRVLKGVFIVRQRANGISEITSANTGRLNLLQDQTHLRMTLENGVSIRQVPGQTASTLRFNHLVYGTDFNLDMTAFRPRGSDERELTFPELWQQIGSPGHGLKRRVYEAEMTDRLVRALTLPILPLLAVPLSFAARRGSRTTGLVLSAAVLVTFNNAVQLGRDLGAAGHGSAFVTGLTPFVVFVVLSAWLFVSSAANPVEAPVVRLMTGLQERAGALAAWLAGARRPS